MRRTTRKDKDQIYESQRREAEKDNDPYGISRRTTLSVITEILHRLERLEAKR